MINGSKRDKRVIINTIKQKEKLLKEARERREQLKDWVLCIDLNTG